MVREEELAGRGSPRRPRRRRRSRIAPAAPDRPGPGRSSARRAAARRTGSAAATRIRPVRPARPTTTSWAGPARRRVPPGRRPRHAPRGPRCPDRHPSVERGGVPIVAARGRTRRARWWPRRARSARRPHRCVARGSPDGLTGEASVSCGNQPTEAVGGATATAPVRGGPRRRAGRSNDDFPAPFGPRARSRHPARPPGPGRRTTSDRRATRRVPSPPVVPSWGEGTSPPTLDEKAIDRTVKAIGNLAP